MEEYLRRIGFTGVPAADADGLRALQRAHLATVPFENLDWHLDKPTFLTELELLDKIVRRRRGGVCYELNHTFAGLLTELGFDARLIAVTVYEDDGELSYPLSHAAIVVQLDEPWLVEVGFGRFADNPLRLSPGIQPDPDGQFEVIQTSEGAHEVHRDGTPVYRLDLRPRKLTDFVPTGWYFATSPDSFFARETLCTMKKGDRRVTLSGDRLSVTTQTGRTDTTLSSEAEILAAYRTEFGIELDRVPGK